MFFADKAFSRGGKEGSEGKRANRSMREKERSYHSIQRVKIGEVDNRERSCLSVHRQVREVYAQRDRQIDLHVSEHTKII